MPAPANDNYAAAQALSTTLPGTLTGLTTKEATFETGTEPQLSYKEQSIWFTFTPTSTGWYRFYVVNTELSHDGSGTHGILQGHLKQSSVLTDFTGTMIDSDTLQTNTSASVQTHLYLHGFLTSGTTYTLKLSSQLGSSPDTADYYTVDFDLHWEAISPPTNDNFASPTTLSTVGLPNDVAGTTWDAIGEVGEPELGGGSGTFDQGVWYEFTPAVTGTYRFWVDNNFPSNPIDSPDFYYRGTQQLNAGSWGTMRLSIWNNPAAVADCTSAADIQTSLTAFTHDTTPEDAELLVVLTASTRYVIKAYSAGQTNPNLNKSAVNFTLRWDLIPPPDNDDFADAEVISGESGSEPVIEMRGATAEVDEPVVYYWYNAAGNTAWYQWTAPSSGRYKFSFVAADGALAVYTGSVLTSLTPIAKSDDSGGDAEDGSAVGFIAVSGTIYKIQIQDDSGAGNLVWEKLADAEGTSQGTAIPITTAGQITGDNFGYTGAAPADADDRLLAENPSYPDFEVGNSVWNVLTTGTVPMQLRLNAPTSDAMYSILVYKDVAGTPTPVTDSLGDDAAYLLDYDDLGTPAVPKSISLDTNSTYYVIVAGWTTSDYAGAGQTPTAADISSVDFEFTLGLRICFDAPDIINPAATSARYDGSLASVVGGGLRVRDTWDAWFDYQARPWMVVDWTLKWTWVGETGLYKVFSTGQLQTATTDSQRAVALAFRVNGKTITTMGHNGTAPSGGPTEYTWTPIEGQADPTNWDSNTEDIHALPWLPLKTGDEIEVQIASGARSGSPSFSFIAYEMKQLCFELEPDTDPDPTSFCTPTWDCEDKPLGDVWGDEDGWGGQRLVPDQIYTHLGYTIDSHGPTQFPWGVDYVDNDMCALEDGTVYVIFKDGWNHGLSQGPTNPDRKTTEYHYTVIKKYDPGSDSWSQIATVNTNPPTQAYRLDAVSCEPGLDGFVYFSWWEAFQYNVLGGGIGEQWKWHLIKLNPATDTYVELGSGQNASTVGVGGLTINYEFETLANHILPMADGDVYVATIEDIRHTTGPGDPRSNGNDNRVFVWRWNGSSWTNLNLPAPTDLGVGTYHAVNGENSFYDRVPTMVAAHAGGPVANGFTLHYPYTSMRTAPPSFFEQMQGLTISYTEGVGWHNEIVTDWTTKIHAALDDGLVPDVDFSAKRDIAFDVDILWSDTLGKLVLVTDFVGGGPGNAWWVWKLNDAGTAWVPVEDAPPSVAAPWRQGRNTSAIGPDGNIWRGMMSEWNAADIDFVPRFAKHSPGYSVNWAGGLRSEMGQETDTGFPWYLIMYATANFRIRIVGQTAYFMSSIYAESGAYGNGQDWWADAHYVFRFIYNPCARAFRPHIYRRVLG